MRRTYVLVFSTAVLVAGGCRLYNLERRLDPANADFLSKVRYIITGEERRIFLEMPDSDKPKFIEEFWSRRDPDPETGENEYQTEYYDRIEEAGRLFPSEGRPGWQTDRGRIFVLFGPPTQRLTYPLENESGCREVWYYIDFPVVFLDDHCSGHYAVAPINLEHLGELHRVQDFFQRSFQPRKKMFDYEVRVVKTGREGEKILGRIAVDIPYSGISFAAGEEGKLNTVLTVVLGIRDGNGAVLWDFENDVPVSIDEGAAEKALMKKLHLEIPFVISGDPERLRRGGAILHVKVRSSASGEELRKVKGFRLKF